MVSGSILVDVLAIATTGGKRDHFTFVFMPVLEIILKLVMIGSGVYNEHRKPANRDEESNINPIDNQ